MRSPIKSFDKIKEDFIRYYDTAYHISCPELEKDICPRPGHQARTPSQCRAGGPL